MLPHDKSFELFMLRKLYMVSVNSMLMLDKLVNESNKSFIISLSTAYKLPTFLDVPEL